MFPAIVRGALVVVGIGLLLSTPACGKKAPLRLTDDRAAEKAPAPRARLREGRVTLDFRVPAHRFFPEREEPWALARILRQDPPSSDVVEAGAILKTGGFAFDSPLSWSDQAPKAGNTSIYRVEFRDAARRRRALSEPASVTGIAPPAAPSELTASGHLRSVVIGWTAPGGSDAGVAYRVYRRETLQEEFEPVSPEPVAGSSFVDSRIEPGRDYCYTVRAVLDSRGVEIEGPSSPESCARALADDAPQQQPATGP